MTPNAFQSVAKAEAVLLPERFRGGCSFGDWVSPMLSRFVSDGQLLDGAPIQVNREIAKG
jgi:hypothetical protein